MAAGDHRLLHVHPVDKELTHSPAITVAGDPAKADSPSFDYPAKVITGSSGPFWLSPLPSQFWSIYASQPDPLTVSCPAGAAVVAAAYGDSLQTCSRLRQSKHQQQHS